MTPAEMCESGRVAGGPSRGSIPAEAARRLNGLQLAEIEFADRLQRLRGGILLQVAGRLSSQAAYSACKAVRVTTASRQR